MHGAFDLGIGNARIEKGDEPNNGDKRSNPGLIVHRLRTLALLSSESCEMLDFLFLAAELFDFELELYRAASVTY